MGRAPLQVAGPALTVELWNDLKKEMIRKFVGWIVAGVIALLATAAAGWWLFLENWLSLRIGTPFSTIIALNDGRTCSELGGPWAEIKYVDGRFLLGAGPHVDNPKLTWAPATPGGQEKYTLSAEQLPNHTHEMPAIAAGDATGTDLYLKRGNMENQNHALSRQTTGRNLVNDPQNPSGPGKPLEKTQPYEVMPPYYVVRFCLKQR